MNTPTAAVVNEKITGQQLVAFPIELFSESREIPKRIHVVPLGTWDHPVYGKFSITRDSVREFISNFSAGIRAEGRLPITAGHDTLQETPAVGWLTQLSEGAHGLYADVEWTPDGERQLAEGGFKYLSPEWYVEYTDPATNANYKHVLVGAALTNKPFFRELEPVVQFSEPTIIDQFNMNKENEEIQASEEVVEEVAPVEEEEAVEEVAEEVAEEELQASVVTIPAAELRALRSQADKGFQAYSQLRTMTLENEAKELVFSSTNTSGKFLPKSKGAVISFMASLTDDQRKKFSTLISQIPTTQLFSEEGTGDNPEEAGVESEVNAKVQTYMEKNTVSYSVALRDVLNQDVKLAERYNERFNA
jgi:hypothetical protein